MRMRAAIGTIALAAIAATTACSGGTIEPCEIGALRDPEMPDLDMQVGDTVETPLEDYFGPRDCLELAKSYHDGLEPWELRSSDPSAVAVSVSADYVLRTVALDVADSVLVGVHNDDDHPLYGYEFVVRVRPPQGGGRR